MSELYHHGILGQKWGLRRFQNKDGTLTEEGARRRYQNEDGSLTDEGARRIREVYSSGDKTEDEQASKYDRDFRRNAGVIKEDDTGYTVKKWNKIL